MYGVQSSEVGGLEATAVGILVAATKRRPVLLKE